MVVLTWVRPTRTVPPTIHNVPIQRIVLICSERKTAPITAFKTNPIDVTGITKLRSAQLSRAMRDNTQPARNTIPINTKGLKTTRTKDMGEPSISNVHAREAFRKHSYFSDLAVGVISGLGAQGYELALAAAIERLKK